MQVGKLEKHFNFKAFWAIMIVLVAVFFPKVFVDARTRPDRNDKVTKISEPVLRVKLGNWHSRVKISFPSGGWQEDNRGRKLKTFGNNREFTWSLPRNGRIQNLGKTLVFKSQKNLIKINGKDYRGFVVISIAKSGAKIINHVGLEDYLRGVVGSEIGSRSPAESIKAQTVIARTYAYANRGRHGSEGADVCDSTHCQVYKGVAAERPSIDPAVKGTRGIVMISEGDPVATLYHGTCGGMTSDNDKVFGGAPRSYLRRVACPFCEKGTYYRWTRKISITDLKKALAKEKIFFKTLSGTEIDANERVYDQRLWINKIRFLKEELDIVQKNLDKMVRYYGNEEFMSEVEQYQNKIIVYQEVADRIIKDYKMLRNKLVEMNGSNDAPEEVGRLHEIKTEMDIKAERFVGFLHELKENFLAFYTSYHLSDNHVFGK